MRLAGDSATAAVTDLSTEFSRFHSGTIEQFASQVNQVMSRIETANNDLRIISGDLTHWAPNSGNFGKPLARSAKPGNSEELQRLLSEKEQLLATPGITPFHFQVTALQKKIESLRNSPKIPAGNASFATTASQNMAVVENQFSRTTSLTENRTGAAVTDESAQRIVMEIQALDLGTVVRELGTLSERIAETRDNAGKITQRMAGRVQKIIGDTSPVIMHDFHKSTASIPIGGTPTGQSFVWLAVFAGLAGITVALNYDPALKIRRFRSLSHLQARLGIPVIASVPLHLPVHAHHPATRRIAAVIVRTGEWTLLVAVVLLIVAALCNSQVAAAILENPFHGITRTVWMLTSHS
jgi:hypothetical protein